MKNDGTVGGYKRSSSGQLYTPPYYQRGGVVIPPGGVVVAESQTRQFESALVGMALAFSVAESQKPQTESSTVSTRTIASVSEIQKPQLESAQVVERDLFVAAQAQAIQTESSTVTAGGGATAVSIAQAQQPQVEDATVSSASPQWVGSSDVGGRRLKTRKKAFEIIPRVTGISVAQVQGGQEHACQVLLVDSPVIYDPYLDETLIERRLQDEEVSWYSRRSVSRGRTASRNRKATLTAISHR